MEKKEKTAEFNGFKIEEFQLQKEQAIPRDIVNSVDFKIFTGVKNNSKNIYMITLKLNIFTVDTKINLSIAGFFEISNNFSDEEKHYFLEVSAPAILYPFARSFISNVTSFDGDSPVLLPIINFAENK